MGELALLLAESLHHSHAVDRFVDDARDFGGSLLGVPGRGEERGAETERDDRDRGEAEQRDDRQQRGEEEHHDERHDHHHQVAEHDRCERE